MKYQPIASVKTIRAFRNHLTEFHIDLPLDEEVKSGSDSPLAHSCALESGVTLGNRLAALPMEGWDGTRDGCPTELTTRRWQNFGKSGAKLIWGGEAFVSNAMVDGRYLLRASIGGGALPRRPRLTARLPEA